MAEPQVFISSINMGPPPKRATDGAYNIKIAANSNLGDRYLSINLDELELQEYLDSTAAVLHNHDHAFPIALTSDLKRNADSSIRAWFHFDLEDEYSAWVHGKWLRGYVRAASIGAGGEIDWREWRLIDPVLKEWSLVSVPADPGAVRSIAPPEGVEMPAGRTSPLTVEAFKSAWGRGWRPGLTPASENRDDNDDATEQESEMTDEEIRALVSTGVADAVREAVPTIVTEVTTAMRTAAQEAEAAVETVTTTERVTVTEEETEGPSVAELAASRVALLRKTEDLLPDGFDADAATDREILEAAIGDTVSDVAERSDDYLQASLDQQVANKAAAIRTARAGRTGGNDSPIQHDNPKVARAAQRYVETAGCSEELAIAYAERDAEIEDSWQSGNFPIRRAS